MLRDVLLRVNPARMNDSAELKKLAAHELHIDTSRINDIVTVRRSIDARQKRIVADMTVRVATDSDSEIKPLYLPPRYRDVRCSDRSVVIVGAGPAGLFAALEAIESGIRPIVLERGRPVEERRQILSDISRTGKVDSDTNYSFGEGGAGAYSDGKLYTRSKKRGDVGKVLGVFHHHGASPDILIDAHPHIGSDKLPGIIRNIRLTITGHGGEVRFNSKVTGLIINQGEAKGAILSDGTTVEGDAVILATGHSARDIYIMLNDSNVTIEAKPLAIGARIEHPQNLIDKIQYHSKEGRGKYLPAAEYSFVTQSGERGVYSFCMCPGGVIVPAATAANQLVVNGMSASARASQWANSGMVVEVRPGDFPQYDDDGPLSMMHLQENLERKFFEASGSSLVAPAQRMTDFIDGRLSKTIPRSSYAPGVRPARLDLLLPPFIASRLQDGLRKFGQIRRGFLTAEAILVGLESRTSSPVRIPRDASTMQHIGVSRLYPAGEGAGYAGGIVSAAIDGIRCIKAFCSFTPTPDSSSAINRKY